MSDFSQFLSQIKQLEDNVVIPINVNATKHTGIGGFSDQASIIEAFDSSSFFIGGTLGQFRPTKSDLGVFLETITPKEGSSIPMDTKPIKLSLNTGISISFYKHQKPDISFDFPSNESLKQITISPDSKPSLSDTIATAKSNTLIVLKPGNYKGPFTISKNISIKSDGNAFFKSDTESFVIDGGAIQIDGIQINGGTFVVNSGNVQIRNSKFSSTLSVQNKGVVSCINTTFTNNSKNCINVTDEASLLLHQCNISGRGLSITDGILVVTKSKIESINGTALQIEGGNCFIEESSIGDCTKSVIHCSGHSVSTFIKCDVFDSENENLLTSTLGATVNIKNGTFSGHCKSTVSSNNSSVHCTGLQLNKPVTVVNSGFLYLLDCSPLTIYVQSSNLLMENCKVIASPLSGLISTGESKIQIQGCTFSNSSSNGIELSKDTCSCILSSQFNQNKGAGALISSKSAFFQNCTFEANTLVGCQIRGPEAQPMFINCNFTENLSSGITSLDGSTPLFNHCLLRQNEQYGAVSSNSSPTFNNCEFGINHGIGFDISNSSTPQLNSCSFDSNSSFAIHLTGSNTKSQFTKCTFSKHISSSSLILDDKSIGVFIDCTFFQSGQCHAEIRNEAKGQFNRCTISESNGGIGIFAHDKGVTEIDNCRIHNENKTAVFAGEKSEVIIVKSEIFDCGICGVFTDINSKSVIQSNVIRNNGGTGIHVEGGETKIDDNQIEHHSEFGVYATSVARILSNENNKFSENVKGDTQIGE